MTRASRRLWIGSSAVAGVVLAIGLGVAFAPQLGLGRVLGISAVLPARSALVVGATAVLVVAAVGAMLRRSRPIAAPIGLALLVVVAATAPAPVGRGFKNPPPASATADQLRVLEWNTNGRLVRPNEIAALAVREKANVIVLPDVEIAETGADYRAAFDTAGLPVRIFSAPGPQAQLAVLLAEPEADHYNVTGAGPDPVKTLVLSPTVPGLPKIVALHAPQPTPRSLTLWRSTLDWVSGQCTAGPVLVAGDFNASVDSFGSARLGACADVAVAQHSGGVGTWPTRLPTVLGMPIDHVLLTPAAGTVETFTVLTGEDHSGARHRPTLTVVRASR